MYLCMISLIWPERPLPFLPSHSIVLRHLLLLFTVHQVILFPLATPKSFHPLLKSNIFPEVFLNPHRNQLQLAPSSVCTVFDKDQVTFIFWPYFPHNSLSPKSADHALYT